MPGLGFKVMLADVDVKLNLFGFHDVLILLGNTALLLLLIAVFPVVEDFADWWIGIGCHAEEIEVVGSGNLVGLLGRHSS